MRAVSVDHYENFPVASVLCPPALRPAVRAIYAFARTADDLADEGEDPPAARLAALAAYRDDLRAVAQGDRPSARWAGVFGPLAAQMQARALPLALLEDLLSAFAQDVTQHRHPDRDSVLDYCRRSANPVGRLLLHLHHVEDRRSLERSDAICTALQLINFWQDLGSDVRRDRLYLPLADCARHGVDPQSVLRGEDGPALRRLLADLVHWARSLMHEGASLALTLPGRAGWELRFVVQGGLRIADKLEARGYDAMLHRPTVDAVDAPRLAWRAVTMRLRPASAIGAAA